MVIQVLFLDFCQMENNDSVINRKNVYFTCLQNRRQSWFTYLCTFYLHKHPNTEGGCRVPIESTSCHNRVAMMVTKFGRVHHVSTFKNRCLYKQRCTHMWVRIVYHFVDSWNIKGFIILSLIYKDDDASIRSIDPNISSIDLT